MPLFSFCAGKIINFLKKRNIKEENARFCRIYTMKDKMQIIGGCYGQARLADMCSREYPPS